MLGRNDRIYVMGGPNMSYTSSHGMEAFIDYPLRPVTGRYWGQQQKPSWPQKTCYYFPKAFPVYRLQKIVSIMLVVLCMTFISIVAFVLAQATSVPSFEKMNVSNSYERSVLKEGGYGALGNIRKLEDHAEYKKSDENYYEGEDGSEDDDDDDEVIFEDESQNNNYANDDDDDEEDEDNENEEFDMNYFDNSFIDDPKQTKESINSDIMDESETVAFNTPKLRKEWKELPKINFIDSKGRHILEDGIVFTLYVEKLLRDPGMNDSAVGRIQGHLRSRDVSKIEEPSWDRCGRPKNQWIELSGGQAACARYRSPDDSLLLGEVLSFYLGRLLGIHHVPPVVLSLPADQAWIPVAEKVLQAGWEYTSPVVLTPWLKGLKRDRMPSALLKAVLGNVTLGSGEAEDSLLLSLLGEDDLSRLMQWSDLLVFDYITGNYDRVASMQDAADTENKLDIMNNTIHNLVRSEATGALWLIDNESGLIDAYNLLYGGLDDTQAQRFHQFHSRMLHSICIFRRSTMEAIEGLANHPHPEKLLVHFFYDHEPLYTLLPDPMKSIFFVKYFSQRVKEAHTWMNECVKKVAKYR